MIVDTSKIKALWITVGVLVVSLMVWLLLVSTRTPQTPNDILNTNNQPPIIETTTDLVVTPKTSPKDNDIELTQTYTAVVNGEKLTVPVVPSKNPQGTKGILTQEVDMTKVINTSLAIEREKVKQEYHKNWEAGVGVGVNNGDVYIPIELQRNYTPDRAIGIEVHISVDKPTKITGGEIKHKWMF